MTEETYSFGYNDDCNECRNLEKDNDRLLEENRRLREALEKYQWYACSDFKGFKPYCPACLNSKEEGHMESCEIRKTLYGSEGLPSKRCKACGLNMYYDEGEICGYCKKSPERRRE